MNDTINYNGKNYKVNPRHIVWDATKDVELKALRSKDMSTADMAEHFDCCENVIYRRLKLLGLTGEPWTPVQDAILRVKHNKATVEELSVILKMNERYIRVRMLYLKLV